MIANKKDTLAAYGDEFEKRVIRLLMTDAKYFERMEKTIDQNMFGDPAFKVWVGLMKQYYHKYNNTVPSFSIMDTMLHDYCHNDIEEATYSDLLKEIRDSDSEGLEYIKDKATRFFTMKYVLRASTEIRDIALKGDLSKMETIQEIFNKAAAVGQEEYDGVGAGDNPESFLSEDYRTPVPTGFKGIDEVLDGGIGKGEVMVLIGPSSFGKTSMTTGIASNAATYKCDDNNYKGYKVLQIVFEDHEKQIQRKHAAKICQIEARELSKPYNIDNVRHILSTSDDYKMVCKNVRILRLPTGEKTAWDIERTIKRIINKGFDPDLVIVDYFECLDHPKDPTIDKWELEGKTMRKFESMANEMNKAFCIPLQGTKDSVSAELVTMDKAGGSFRKIQIAHIVMSIARSTEDIANNKATIAILKNRAGRAGQSFEGAYFNNGTCIVDTDQAQQYGSMMEFGKQQEGKKQDIQNSMLNAIAERTRKPNANVYPIMN